MKIECYFGMDLLIQKYSNHSRQLYQIHSLLITTGWLISSRISTSSPTFVYNSLIRAHLLHKDPGRAALHLYTQMLSSQIPPNSHTFPLILKASATLQCPFTGCSIHAQVVRRGLVLDDFINCCTVKFYAEVGDLHCSWKMFDEMPRPDIVSCNSMLDAQCRHGDISVAIQFFEEMHWRDVVTWTTLINGFSSNGHFGKAIQLFRDMVQKEDQRAVHGLRPNEATFVSVLSACANSDGARALYQGREIHGYVVRHDIRLTAFLGTALIDMYGKRGCLHCAENAFRAVTKKEVCTWNAMILALTCNGKEAEALDMFGYMTTEGFRPNGITFAVILAGCARAGMVDFALTFFESMSSEFSIVPTMEHYGCVVDLLGRRGLLVETVQFIRRMPIEPDASVLGALLGACKVHGDVHLAAYVGKQVLALQPWHSGRYTVLSNIYAGAGIWGTSAELREAMEQAGIKKITGHSWLDSANGLP